MIDDLTIGMIGRGGDGVVAAGEILSSTASMLGLNSLMVKTYGAQIRGGESLSKTRISNGPVMTQGDCVDVLIAFNWKDYNSFKTELEVHENTVIIYPEGDTTSIEEIPVDAKCKKFVYKIPFKEMAIEAANSELAKNMIIVGVLTSLAGLPIANLEKSLANKFKKKTKEVLEGNLKALNSGYKFSEENMKKSVPFKGLRFTQSAAKLMMTGNEVSAIASLYAGCRFYSGYPITPSSEVMEILGKEYPKVGGRMVQTEDEISALGMALGASFAGHKAFTATSGPGVSLMNEMIGLSAIAELPVVILNVMRGGPSTGIPTKTEQADLQQALFSTHGDAPKVVIAPTEVKDCFDATTQAFYIAEKYQTPVIILSDQFIGQRKESIDKNEFTPGKSFLKVFERPLPPEEELTGEYKRYMIDKNPIVPMTWPGVKKGMYLAAGIEHDEYGHPSSLQETHEQMNEKRYKKMELLIEEFHNEMVEEIGPKDASCGIICWGSTKGVVVEVINKLNKDGYKIKALIPKILYPVPEAHIRNFISTLKKILVIEMSYSKQFYYYLKSFADLPKEAKLFKRSGGAPFTVEEIRNAIKEAF